MTAENRVHPIPFASAFISHASEDKQIALDLVAKLEANGCKCWCSSKQSIALGTQWDREIMQGLRNSEVLILLLTRTSNASEHVEREVKLAFGMKKPVLPIRFGNVEPSDALSFWLAAQQLVDVTPDEAGLDAVLNALSGVQSMSKAKRRARLPRNSMFFVVAILSFFWAMAAWITLPRKSIATDQNSASLLPRQSNVEFFTLDEKPLNGAVIDARRALDMIYPVLKGWHSTFCPKTGSCLRLNIVRI